MRKCIWAGALFIASMVAIAADTVPKDCRNEDLAYSAYAHPDPDSNIWSWCDEQVRKGRYPDHFFCTDLSGKYDFEREMIQAGEILRQCQEKAAAKGQRGSM